MKKILISSLAALALTACGNATNTASPGSSNSAVQQTASELASQSDEMVNAKTKAVLLYADWCSSCKILDPVVNEVQKSGNLQSVEFVVLDYTDKDEANFYAQANAAGVESAVRDYLAGTVKTGQLLLVDVDDAKVIGKVTKTDAAPAILTKIKEAVSAS